MGHSIWQRCPRCKGRRVRIEGKKENSIGILVRLLMEVSGFIIFIFTLIFVTMFLTFITNNTNISLIAGLISAAGITICVVKRFKDSSGRKTEHILFCKDCEFRFSK